MLDGWQGRFVTLFEVALWLWTTISGRGELRSDTRNSVGIQPDDQHIWRDVVRAGAFAGTLGPAPRHVGELGLTSSTTRLEEGYWTMIASYDRRVVMQVFGVEYNAGVRLSGRGNEISWV